MYIAWFAISIFGGIFQCQDATFCFLVISDRLLVVANSGD